MVNNTLFDNVYIKIYKYKKYIYILRYIYILIIKQFKCIKQFFGINYQKKKKKVKYFF